MKEYDLTETKREVIAYQQGFKDGINEAKELIDKALSHVVNYVNNNYPAKSNDKVGQDVEKQSREI